MYISEASFLLATNPVVGGIIWLNIQRKETENSTHWLQGEQQDDACHRMRYNLSYRLNRMDSQRQVLNTFLPVADSEMRIQK